MTPSTHSTNRARSTEHPPTVCVSTRVPLSAFSGNASTKNVNPLGLYAPPFPVFCIVASIVNDSSNAYLAFAPSFAIEASRTAVVPRLDAPRSHPMQTRRGRAPRAHGSSARTVTTNATTRSFACFRLASFFSIARERRGATRND